MKKKRNITSIQAITVVIKAPVISSIVLEFLDCLISSYSSYGYLDKSKLFFLFSPNRRS